MAVIPPSHITDGHQLNSDGKVHLFALTPSIGSGTLYFKNDEPETWLGNYYDGIPLTLEGESFSAEGTSPQPTLIIGQPNIDLSLFKPLIWSGGLDNARIVRYKVLVTDMLANNDIKETNVYRVKRVDGYSATQIRLVLATFSASGPTSIPFRQYLPPDFPFVVL